MISNPDTETVRRLRERVLIVTGAGASAESSIPIFRGAGGYWRNHDPRQLATVHAFERDPALVWTVRREVDAHPKCTPEPGA